MLCKLNFTRFEYNPIILVSISFQVRFPNTLDQSSDSEYVTFKKRSTPLDPSNILWALHRKLSTNKQVSFQFNTQQHVPEILQMVFDELKGHSTIASNILATSVRTSTTCDTCGCCNIDK